MKCFAKVAEGPSNQCRSLKLLWRKSLWSMYQSTGDGQLLLGQNEREETVEERTAIAKVMQAYAVAIPTEVQGNGQLLKLG